MVDEYENPIEECTDDDGKKGGKQKAELIQDIEGFKIYRAAHSFIVKYPSTATQADGTVVPIEVFGGYYTTLGACVRSIIVSDLNEKLIKRTLQEKKNLDSLKGIIECHEDFVRMVTSQFDSLRIKIEEINEEKKAKRDKKTKASETTERDFC